MKNGAYIVVYEICGSEQCYVYYKTSKDDFNWPVGFSNLIPEQTGGSILYRLKKTLVVTSNKGNISISQDNGFSGTWTSGPGNTKKIFQRIGRKQYGRHFTV
jgi:hypothetical protein